jgi:hypothetical protein
MNTEDWKFEEGCRDESVNFASINDLIKESEPKYREAIAASPINARL